MYREAVFPIGFAVKGKKNVNKKKHKHAHTEAYIYAQLCIHTCAQGRTHIRSSLGTVHTEFVYNLFFIDSFYEHKNTLSSISSGNL